jgi:mono/diheme cytochrome c family protein
MENDMNRWIKRAAIAAIILATTTGASALAVQLASQRALSRDYVLPRLDLAIATGAAALDHGRHLYVTRGCIDCHGADLGGRLAIDAGPVATLYGPNLTRGGRGAAYDLPAFEHAVRHAVSAEGRALRFMPSEDYAAMADSDLAALHAYVWSVPPLPTVQPDSTVGLLGRALFLAGELPLVPAERIDHVAASAPKSVPDTTDGVAYGHYLAQTCTGCHGPGLAGGHVPGTPPDFADAANLTPAADGLAGWTRDDFVRAVRRGRRPDGRELDAFMPWRNFAQMSDAELDALWQHLRTLPPRPLGSR